MTPVTRRAAGALLGAVLLWALAGLAAAPAQAHNVLRSTTPAADAQVDVPPAAVTLEFDEPAIAAGTEIEVTGPDGVSVDAGDLLLSNTTVAQPISDALPAGAYRVLWRATSSDGHPISGEFAFTALAASAVPTPTDTPTVTASPTATETPTPAATPTADETPAATPAATPTETVAADPASGSSTPWVLVGVVAVAALLVGGGLLASRRRRDPNGPPGQS